VRGIRSLAEELLASQEALCSVELVVAIGPQNYILTLPNAFGSETHPSTF